MESFWKERVYLGKEPQYHCNGFSKGGSSLLPHPLMAQHQDKRSAQRVIFITGPTAAGKSRLAIELARMLGGEIISADSVQVYRGLDIGTAKVSQELRREIPHHLIDVCSLTDAFNVVRFYEMATEAIQGSLARGHVPIVVGGTGFYVRALLLGPPAGPPADKEVRKQLEADADKFGIEALYAKVCQCDPKYAETINPSDRHKVVRALEVMMVSGKKVTDFASNRQNHLAADWDCRCWFVYFPKSILFPRIEMRCDEMIARGFVSEVEELVREGLESNLSACQAVGYRQCLQFLRSPRQDVDWEQFVWEFKKATRRYAKRQFTWFRKEPVFRWIDLDVYNYQQTLEYIAGDYESRY